MTILQRHDFDTFYLICRKEKQNNEKERERKRENGLKIG